MPIELSLNVTFGQEFPPVSRLIATASSITFFEVHDNHYSPRGLVSGRSLSPSPDVRERNRQTVSWRKKRTRLRRL